MTPGLTLRAMTAPEYAAYAREVQDLMVSGLIGTMPEDAARARAAQGFAQHLPDGLDTPDHRLFVAEDDTGAVVGTAWVGPELHGGPDSAGAWLFGIDVRPDVRGRGFGRALLAAIEAQVVQDGRTWLGLNVFPGNETAIRLYTSSGYAVTSQHMVKRLG